MKGTQYTTKEAVMKRAHELVEAQLPFKALDKTGRIAKKNKGDLGQLIEESWYEYHVNNESEPDFPEAGVELKVSPYKNTRNGVSAKERLVCNVINYCDEAGKVFETSSFWHKNKCICLLSYLWSEGIPKDEMFVDHATLLDRYPAEDLAIIKQDWEKIIQKIRDGKAHELTEGDTMYLSACTKGETAEKSLREQPFSDIPAKQRAYSLKTTYMTKILRRYIFGKDDDEHIIKDWRVLAEISFDQVILNMFEPYIGKTVRELMTILDIKASEIGPTVTNRIYPKSVNAVIARRIIGLTGNKSKAAEFENANIQMKTVRFNKNGMIEQNMSFPAFKFMDIVDQDWEDSKFYEKVISARFLFVIFHETDEGDKLTKAVFWNMPAEDVEEAHKVWDQTIISIREGAGLYRGDDGRIYNSLPKESGSRVAHVRPHTGRAAYLFLDGTRIGDVEKHANVLPNGVYMTTQGFWLNRRYIRDVLEGLDNETS